MGEQNITGNLERGDERRSFMKRLLRDVRALDHMIAEGLIERGVRRIGAEQELFLVDAACRPAPVALELLEALEDPHYTTELGLFNLEYNLDPQRFGARCLSEMEAEVVRLERKARRAARALGGDIVMTGILPTLHMSDMDLSNMTPWPRYRALNDSMNELRGQDFAFYIQGADEFMVKHGSVMLETCNTSFQVHFQVGAEEFARLYNIAQVVAAPAMAVAANAALLFGKRLWHETRIALLEQSVDTRASTHHMRELNPRVMFGTRWVEESVLEIFREDIARFRLLIATELGEDPFEALEAGRIPRLDALSLHNGTVYRWNRPCYGVLGGKPHLRIENRVFPAGPTAADEVANAALWFGLMCALADAVADVREVIAFDTARQNFYAAARLGLNAPLTWFDGRSTTARELLLDHLLERAHDALCRRGLDPDDVAHYLGIIEARAGSGQTGACWQLQSFTDMRAPTPDGSLATSEKLAALTAATIRHQERGEPVHTWPLATTERDGPHWTGNYQRVEQLMSTDLFTVNEDELVDLVACVMDWQHLRHVPVEDANHHLVGLVTQRSLLGLLADGHFHHDASAAVAEIMHRDPLTVAPDTPTLEALRLMREHGLTCLPVVKAGKLVGIVTERDFLGLATDLLEERLRDAG